jgi:hypothetical protein
MRPRTLWLLAPASLTLASCGSYDEPRADFASADPAERSLALAEAASRDREADLPRMIAMLDSDDPAVRMFAQRALEERTGQTLDYHFAAPERERREAVDRWVAWYERRAGGVADE